jgi:hypothetical protein
MYYIKLNIFLCIILTPVSYIVINGGLIYYKQFNNVHQLLDQTIILPPIESIIRTILFYIVGKINQISYVNKFYLFLKVKFLIYVFKLIANVIPEEKINETSNELREELKNDYLDILNKNRRKRLEQ